ncbi:MAG: CDP-glycerol glycerophosphotransferase family protein [Candidatus Stygibacter frigidus]|nr:CDP-glycerol glycerophosphotransferase family protein [Candidatus Stygibacter frigidus]
MKNRLIRAIISNPLNIFKILYLNLKMFLFKLQGKKTIVYNIQMDYFYNTFEPIYLELLKNNKIVVYFAYYEGLQKLSEHLRQFVPSENLISSLISPFVWFDMFITAEINGPDFPVSFLPTHRIQMYHGIGVAPRYNKSDVLSRFNTHFAAGPQAVKFIKTLPHEKSKQNDYEEIGFPKLDAISNPDIQFVEKLKKHYNIQDQFVILYAPHWNPNGSLHVLSLDLVARLTQLENVIIMIKVHNFLYVQYKEANWEKKLQQFADKYDNVIYVTRPNTQEIFPLSDMLITDALTTTAFEFSLTWKPVFAFECPGWFAENKHSEVENEIRKTAICFLNIDEIYQYTQELISGKPELLEKIEDQKQRQKQLINNYLFQPGNATQTAVDVIIKKLQFKNRNRLYKMITNPSLDIFRIIYWNLKMISVKLSGKKTIVINVQTDYFYSIFEPVYNVLKKDKNIKIYFSVFEFNQTIIDFLKLYVPVNSLISSYISPFIYFDLFITAEINGPDFPVSLLPTTKIQMYHGSGVYPLYNKTDVLSRFNVHFAVGPQFVEFIKTLPHNRKDQNKCAKIGYPKTDAIFFPDQKFTDKLKKEYNINDQFVILYTPHWNSYGSLHVLSLEMINQLAKLQNVVILIKVHHFLFTKFKGYNWKQVLSQFCLEHQNVVLVTRPNTQEIFTLGDMMITDTGTTSALEFSITKKPVFVFFNQQWFDHNQNTEVEKQIIDTAINFTTIDEIVDYTQKRINGNADLAREILDQQIKQQLMIDKFLFNPGKATEAAVKVIKQELWHK